MLRYYNLLLTKFSSTLFQIKGIQYRLLKVFVFYLIMLFRLIVWRFVFYLFWFFNNAVSSLYYTTGMACCLKSDVVLWYSL
jgi:hypothetical protein